METPKQTSFNVHLPLDVHAELKRDAQKARRSVKQHVSFLLIEYLERVRDERTEAK